MVPYFSPQFLFKFVKRISPWPWWLWRKNEQNAEISVWNLETKALGPWVIFSFESSSTISSILLWWLKCQHCYNHEITSAESTEKEENRSCYEGLIMCDAQPGATCRWCSEECQHLFHLLIPRKKVEEGKATENTLQSSLVYIRTYDFSPDQHFTSDIQIQKAVIIESFFITLQWVWK